MKKPIILDPNKNRDKKLIEKYKKTSNVVDTLADQLLELFKIKQPTRINYSKKEAINYFRSLGIFNQKELGLWSVYPWNRNMVKILPEDSFVEILTSRNRNLISYSEQQKFYNSSIAIAGLSVGSNCAFSIAQSGGGKHMSIADFDNLSLSNMNRISSGIHYLGKNKCYVAAARLFELNPYMKINVYPKGLSDESIGDFLTKPKKISLLVEEMDNLYLKVRIRILARKLGIPVLMVTDNGEGVIIDIERYDIEPRKPLFNSSIPESELLSIRPDTPRIESAKIISRLVGVENISIKMIESLQELGKSLYTWPQLGTAASIGGNIVAALARKIIAGHNVKSKRITLKIEDYISPNSHTRQYSTALRKQFVRDFM